MATYRTPDASSSSSGGGGSSSQSTAIASPSMRGTSIPKPSGPTGNKFENTTPSFADFDPQRREFVKAKTTGLADNSGTPKPIGDAAQRVRAQRFRGGRVGGGGTHGWGFGKPQGDSDLEPDEEQSNEERKENVQSKAPYPVPITLVAPGSRQETEWRYWTSDSSKSFWKHIKDQVLPFSEGTLGLRRIAVVFDDHNKLMWKDILQEKSEIPLDEIRANFDGSLPVRWRIVLCRDFIYLKDSSKPEGVPKVKVPLRFDPHASRRSDLRALGQQIVSGLKELFQLDAHPQTSTAPAFSFNEEHWQDRGDQEIPSLSENPADVAQSILWNIDSSAVVVGHANLAPELQTQSKIDVTKDKLCPADQCHARLGNLSAQQQSEHKTMHERYTKDLASARYLRGWTEKKKKRILRLQNQIPRHQLLARKLRHECRAVYDVLAEVTAKLADATSSKDDEGAIVEHSASTTVAPPPLPSEVAQQASQTDVYDQQTWTKTNLRPLFTSGHTYCNRCLAYQRGYATYKHAAECKTTPWNFVTLKAKKQLRSNETAFTARYPRPDQGPNPPRAIQKGTTRPQKRKRASQAEYKAGKNDEAEEEDIEGGDKSRKAKKPRRESQQQYKYNEPAESEDE